MKLIEVARFVGGALLAHRLRSVLSGLGVAIGVASVVLLTSLGEGTREYIVSQFTQFGTNLIAVNPGKIETTGMPSVFGGTTHALEIDDAEALRRIRGVDKVVPLAMGQARVEARGRGRSVYVYGVNHEADECWQFPVGQGMFIPPMDPRRQAAVTVLGPKVAREIFREESALGQRVRIGGRSFMVIGVMEPKGQLLGFDLDDSAYIPVGSAMSLFNLHELQEIDITTTNSEVIPRVMEDMKTVLMERHRGEEDFTITSQDQMLETFGKILNIVTMAVTAIGGISLFVGAMGILTIMWISVHERTAEIGLLRSLGLTRRGVARLFVTESALLALGGGAAGVGAGLGIGLMLKTAVPGFPLAVHPGAIVAAIAMSLLVGIASGYLPARRAASLDPVEALRAE